VVSAQAGCGRKGNEASHFSGNIGSAFFAVQNARRAAMDTNRRTFIIGAGALITAAFVRKADAFSQATGEPFLLPGPSTRETLWVNRYDDQLLISLGPDVYEPDPPTWAEFFELRDRPRNRSEWESLLIEWELAPSDLEKRVDERVWSEQWSFNLSPAAKANDLLRKIDLGEGKFRSHQAGGLNFMEGQYPGSFDRWVEAEDLVSVSLLQARIRELNLPLSVRLADANMSY
jgi:hypothetical protein